MRVRVCAGVFERKLERDRKKDGDNEREGMLVPALNRAHA